MSSRSSNDNTSASGVSYPTGISSATSIKNVKYSQHINDSTLVRNGAFNGHAVEVWADGAVFDTVTGSYLFPGRDYNPTDIQKR
jgi:hypothetical protein